MLDPFQSGQKKRGSALWLKIDSWIDSHLYGLFTGFGRAYESFSARMDRFSVGGWKRVGVELVSDAWSLGVLGLIVVLAFARPAFEETRADYLRQADYSVTFLDRYGDEIGKRGILHNDGVPLEELPDYLIKATLATEDRRFFEHFGIDPLGTLRAILANAQANGVVQGGSTLTQQLAKNLFLSSERTLERKIKEAFLALWLETNLSKTEILKLYLDRAYMGGGAFGVDAASQFYFGKSVRDISLAEAAMLSGLYKAPGRYAPHLDLPAARARASEVLENMVQAGFLTEGQVYAARRNPASVVSKADHYTPDYFLDWVYEEVLRRAQGTADRVLTVKTTVDVALQRYAEQSIQATLRQHGAEQDVEQGALVSLESDGAVRAIVGGRDYGESQFNRATQALRQPGSSFKPYVYLAAFQHGFEPKSIVQDAPISIGNWSPQNYNRKYAGRVSLTTALARSINTVPVRLAQAIGRDKIVDAARALGITSPLTITRSMPLGVTEMTVMEQAVAYATFASGGRKVEPYGVVSIRNSAGEVIYARDRDVPPPPQVVPREPVEQLNYVLSQVVEAGTARRAALEGIKSAGKTGTTQGYRDAWFVGYTGQFTTAVWFGNDDYTPMARVTGGSLPAQTWQRYMAFAHAGLEVPPIPGVEDSGGAPPAFVAAAEGEDLPAISRPRPLSAQTETVLLDIARAFRDASATASGPSGARFAQGSTDAAR